MSGPRDLPRHHGGAPPRFRTKKELIKKADEYFESHQIWTISGLSLYLGFCSVQSLHDYEKRSEFSEAILRIKAKLQDHVEQKLYLKTSAGGAVFFLKSQAGWRDRQEIDLTSGGNPLAAASVVINYSEKPKVNECQK